MCACSEIVIKFSHGVELVFDVAVLFVVLSEEAMYDAFAHACWLCGGTGDTEEEVHWFLVGTSVDCVVVD